MSMNYKNMKLKNISLISPMTFYNKANPFVYTEVKREHHRGASSHIQLNNRIMINNASLLHRNNNYQSSPGHNKDSKAYSHSKSGRLTRDDIDQMIKSASNSFSMLNSRYQFTTKRHRTDVRTDRNVKSNSSNDYQLVTSPSSPSSIGKQQVNSKNTNNKSLRNIKVFYNELSKNANQDKIKSDLNSNNNSNIINTEGNSITNKIKKYCENIASNDNQGINLLHQPSTKTTKESTDNSMKSKNKSNPKSYINTYPNNMNMIINSNEINTPEELHYFYVNILQNGKEIEIGFDKTSTPNDNDKNKEG